MEYVLFSETSRPAVCETNSRPVPFSVGFRGDRMQYWYSPGESAVGPPPSFSAIDKPAAERCAVDRPHLFWQLLEIAIELKFHCFALWDCRPHKISKQVSAAIRFFPFLSVLLEGAFNCRHSFRDTLSALLYICAVHLDRWRLSKP